MEKTVEARDAVRCRLVMSGTAKNAIFALVEFKVGNMHFISNCQLAYPTKTVA
jgi:hypothetical protein